jgi:hypothetical protein
MSRTGIVTMLLVVALGRDEQVLRPHTHSLISNEIFRLGGETEGPSKLVRVVFQGARFESAHFEMLSHLNDLREFHCNDVRASSSAMRHLEMLPLLERIDINGGVELVNGFKYLKTKACLREITLQNTVIGEESLNAIATVPNLRFLHLDRVTVHKSAVDVLPKIANKVEVWCTSVDGISEEEKRQLELALMEAETLRNSASKSAPRTNSGVRNR